ncbi:MAG: 4Fe-4S dicluster domain-containing protein [Nitrososphaerota archaeon]|nr:4Fe-4S dicluster domain-containing protein [Candidatus Bathyarchaeota archaeon]MDW8023926.1 4Fe-4S dicluster domain-containing protein [Nitrososphaerota archaeon]
MSETKSEAREYVPPVIKAEELDPKFKYKISKMHGAEKVMACFQCGTCTADCPISRFSEFYRPRKIARMVQLGLKDRLLLDKALWLCSACFTCVDHCPQGVEIAGIVRVLRNMTVEDKNILPLVYKELATNLMKSGFVYEIPESRLQKRVEQGLPPLPKPNVKDVMKIFEVTGSARLIEKVQTVARVESK